MTTDRAKRYAANRNVLEAVYKLFVSDLSVDRKRLEWLRLKLNSYISNEDGKAHGTAGTYTNGCRCDECTKAKRNYNLLWRHRTGRSKLTRAERAAKHGTTGKYKAGCRCEPCKVAARDALRKWRAAKRTAA